MNRILLTFAAFAAAASAPAILDLQFTSPAGKTLVLVPGATGVVSGYVIGVQNDVAPTGSLLNLSPANYSVALTAEFQDYLDLNTSADYSGSILEVAALAGATPGLYFGSATISDGGPLPDGENFAVQVTPEPSAFVAAGLGMATLVRRRRKA